MFLLFRRRNRHRNQFHAVYAHDSAWQGEKRQLTDKLNEVENERAHLRGFLQVNDTQDSQDVVDAFKRLNVSVRNLSLTTSNGILKAVRVKSPSTANASNVAQLELDLDGAAGLVSSDQNAGRLAKDFLPEAFRFVINSVLDKTLFQSYHPFVPKNESDLLQYTYQQVRSRGEFSEPGVAILLKLI